MTKLSYTEAKAIQEAANAACQVASVALSSVEGLSSGPMGLTPLAVRMSPEYITAKAEFDRTFAHMRKINQWFCKEYKREYAQDNKEKRELGLEYRQYVAKCEANGVSPPYDYTKWILIRTQF